MHQHLRLLQLNVSFLNSIMTLPYFYLHKEAVSRGILLKILQNSQENAFARVSFLIKLQVWGLQLY